MNDRAPDDVATGVRARVTPRVPPRVGTPVEARPGDRAPPPGAAPAGQGGLAVATVAVGLGAAVVALVLVVDLAAYLVTAARAQDAADGAALAAISVADPRAGGGPAPPGGGDGKRAGPTGATGNPRTAARGVAEAAGALLVGCACPPGARQVTVTVEMEVRTVAVGRVAARRVRSTATARLVPAPPGASPSAGPPP